MGMKDVKATETVTRDEEFQYPKVGSMGMKGWGGGGGGAWLTSFSTLKSGRWG